MQVHRDEPTVKKTNEKLPTTWIDVVHTFVVGLTVIGVFMVLAWWLK